MIRLTFSLVPSLVLLAGTAVHAAAAGPHALSAPIAAPSAAPFDGDPVNDKCPVRGGHVDPESPTRTYKAHTIGFCCPGCEKKWEAKPEAEKMAFLVQYVPDAAKAEATQPAEKAEMDAAVLDARPAVRVARAYLAACEKADAAALDALFLDKGRATVSENAGDEGSWETYRDHHLMPELKEMPSFKMTVRKEDVQTFGSTSIVRHIGSFTVPDPNHADAPRKYNAAVTYVVVEEGGSPKIAHLHWSSRAERPPQVNPEAPKTGTGHGQTGVHDHK